MLLCAGLACLAGCLDDGTVTGSGPSAVGGLRFAPGDRFRFDVWQIDGFGYRIGSTRAVRVWQVADTGRVLNGAPGVAVVVDSGGPAGASPDTLLFRNNSGGDLLAWGFLARLVQRREGRVIPAGWDRIAAFSVGLERPWAVGRLDSAGSTSATGIIAAEVQYFALPVNGTLTYFPAYRVELTTPAVELVFWLSEAPPCVPRLREELLSPSPGTGIAGELRELTEVSAPR